VQNGNSQQKLATAFAPTVGCNQKMKYGRPLKDPILMKLSYPNNHLLSYRRKRGEIEKNDLIL